MLALLVSCRERENEGRSLSRSRVDLQAAAVRLGDRARDEQSEAGAGLRAAGDVNASELLEDARVLLSRDSRSRVADRDAHAAVGGERADGHLAVFGRVL